MGNDTDYLGRLQDYYAEHRVLPSYSTIMSLMGYRSKSPAAALITRLKLRGYLDVTADNRIKPGRLFFERVVFDSVQAGMPQAVEDRNSETLTIDQYLIETPSTTILLNVKGDSMIDAGIHQGDTVVIDKRRMASVGDIVVAIVDNEFTLKTLAKEKNQFILKPANPAFPVIRPKGNLEIFGVVVGQFRKYK